MANSGMRLPRSTCGSGLPTRPASCSPDSFATTDAAAAPAATTTIRVPKRRENDGQKAMRIAPRATRGTSTTTACTTSECTGRPPMVSKRDPMRTL